MNKMDGQPYLSGAVAGGSHGEMLAKAKAAATAYFGVECVQIKMEQGNLDETVQTTAGEVVGYNFYGGFTAIEYHILNPGSAGPDTCRNCGEKSWPHAPLYGGVAP